MIEPPSNMLIKEPATHDRAQVPARQRLEKCFSTLGCPELKLEAVAKLAQAFQINWVEVRALESRIDLPEYLEAQSGGWAMAKSLLKRYGLGIRVLGTSFKLVGNTPDLRRELQRFGALAEALGVPYLRVFGGGVWGMELSSDDYDEAARAVSWWREVQRKNGWHVELLVETHDAFSASTPCLELQSKLAKPVGLIWDSHHTWRLGGESPRESWKKLGAFVRHVHLKDSISKPSARHPFTYVMPGEGEMPLREVVDQLSGGGYVGALSLEWEKMWHPYLPPLSEALRGWEQLALW